MEVLTTLVVVVVLYAQRKQEWKEQSDKLLLPLPPLEVAAATLEITKWINSASIYEDNALLCVDESEYEWTGTNVWDLPLSCTLDIDREEESVCDDVTSLSTPNIQDHEPSAANHPEDFNDECRLEDYEPIRSHVNEKSFRLYNQVKDESCSLMETITTYELDLIRKFDLHQQTERFYVPNVLLDDAKPANDAPETEKQHSEPTETKPCEATTDKLPLLDHAMDSKRYVDALTNFKEQTVQVVDSFRQDACTKHVSFIDFDDQELFAWFASLPMSVQWSDVPATTASQPISNNHSQVVQDSPPPPPNQDHQDVVPFFRDTELRVEPRPSLRSHSTKVFKHILRSNIGQSMVDPPDVVSWLKALPIKAWKLAELFDHSDATESDGLSAHPTIRNLPALIVHEDEARLCNAGERLEDDSSLFLRTMLCSPEILPPRSIEVAALRIPNLLSGDNVFAFPDLCDDAPPDAVHDPPEAQDASNSEPPLDPIVSTQAEEQEPRQCKPEELPDEESEPPEPMKPIELPELIEDDRYATTEDLVSGFMRAISSDPTLANVQVAFQKSTADVPVHNSTKDERVDGKLQQFARPAIWHLTRLKLLRLPSSSMNGVLRDISLEVLPSIVYQLQARMKRMMANPSSHPHDELVEASTSLRQAVWLYVLRLTEEAKHPNERKTLVSRILECPKYKQAIGKAHVHDLIQLGGIASPVQEDPTVVSDEDEDQDLEAPRSTKRPKNTLIGASDTKLHPVRLICSMEILSHDELIDEISSDYAISVVERDLQHPVDLIVDELCGICVTSHSTFTSDETMKMLTYKLAFAQSQYERLWIIIELEEQTKNEALEDQMLVFFTALVHFTVDVQILTSTSTAETSRLIRSIVDTCADCALQSRRILPRMWFERPFMLEEESQHERLLSSTTILNPFAAQSLLHRIALHDLLEKDLHELLPLAQGAVTDQQLEMLWK